MAVHNADLDLAGNLIQNPNVTESVPGVSDLLLYLNATSGNVEGFPVSDTSPGYVPGGVDVAVADGGTGASDAATARTNLGVPALAAVIDRYIWSYDSYDLAATVIPQKVCASGTIVAVRIIAVTAPTGAESWTVFKNGATTSETVTLATTATEEDDTTGWATTVVAGDDLYPDPTSSPSVASTNGSIVIEVART